MPTYDYRCEACGHTLAEFHGITEAPLRKCPKCGKRKLVRLIGMGAGIIFKGSGFYETDYKRARASTGGGEQKPSSSGSDPAAKSEPKKPEPKKSE